MQDAFLGHPKLGLSWKFVYKDGKRSAIEMIENCILTMIYFDLLSSFVKPIKYMEHYKIILVLVEWPDGSN